MYTLCKTLLLAVLLLGVKATLTEKIDVVDYVIIGGGGAGSALASRLSEDPTKQVLVLHRGADIPCPICDNDTFASNTSPARVTDDDYFSSPQLFVQRSVREVRSNLPGGGTRIYGGVNLPSAQTLIDSAWPKGLNYSVMNKYYNKLQDHFCHYLPFSITNITQADCNAYHGVLADRTKIGGMSISPPEFDSSYNIARDQFLAASQFGVNYVPDPMNPAYQKGSYIFPQPIFNNRDNPYDVNSRRTRESTWTGYLPLSIRQSRKNLEFRTEAEGRQLIYAKDLLANYPTVALQLGLTLNDLLQTGGTPRVVGVRYLYNEGQFAVAFARKQVVLSAGVEGTPHFLQHNGIGPADLLTSVGIPVVANNPAIGQNVAAHAAVPMAFLATQYIPIFANNGPNQYSHMLLSSPYSQGWADIEIELFFGIGVSDIDPALTGNIDLYLNYPPDANGSYPFISFLVEVVNPSARGSVNVTSNRFYEPTQVDYGWAKDFAGYAAHPDYQKLTWAYAKMRDIFLGNNTWAKKYIKQELVPGGGGDFYTDIIHSAKTQHDIYHLTGGTNIGSATDLDGAVKGVTGLTVCDNSLIPHPPNGNPTTTLLALCEYVVDRLIAKAK